MALSRSLQRRLAHGGNAMVLTVLVVVLVGLLYGVADRNRVRRDFSADATNRLLPDTIKKLELGEDGGEPVRVTAFSAQAGKQDAYFKNRALQDLLEELDYQSAFVETRFVDFDRERLTAESLGVRDYGHLTVQLGEKRVDLKDRELFRRVGSGKDRKLEFMGEAAFNRSVGQLLSDKRRIVYTLRGHGERDPEDSGPDGLSELAMLLDQENYELEALDLFRDREGDEAPIIPLDGAGLLIARPLTTLTQPEEDAVVAYLASGKPLMVWVDPGTPVPSVLGRFAMTVPGGLVMDKQLVFPFPDRPVPRYRSHAITSDLADQSLVSVLAHVAPLKVSEPHPDWLKVNKLLETSRQGWIDRGGQLSRGTAVFESAIDEEGPAVMAYALQIQPDANGPVEPGKRVARVVVVGDSEWASNGLLNDGPGNATLAVNAFRWMLWDDARLSVIGKPTKVRKLALTAEDKAMLRWLVLGLMPMLTVLVGLGVWAGRRGR